MLLRKYTLSLTACCFLLATPAISYAKLNQALHEWLKYYYLHRDNRQIVPAINYFFAEQTKVSELRKISLLGSFAILFQQHPEQAADWIKDSNLTKQQRKPLITSLWYAGMANAAVKLAKQDSWTPAEIEKISRPGTKLVDIPINHSNQIGLLWGAYRISGNQKYIDRVIRILLDSERQGRPDENSKVIIVAAQSLHVYLDQHEQATSQYEKIRQKLSPDDALNLDLLLSENEVTDQDTDCD